MGNKHNWKRGDGDGYNHVHHTNRRLQECSRQLRPCETSGSNKWSNMRTVVHANHRLLLHEGEGRLGMLNCMPAPEAPLTCRRISEISAGSSATPDAHIATESCSWVSDQDHIVTHDTTPSHRGIILSLTLTIEKSCLAQPHRCSMDSPGRQGYQTASPLPHCSKI